MTRAERRAARTHQALRNELARRSTPPPWRDGKLEAASVPVEALGTVDDVADAQRAQERAEDDARAERREERG